MSDEIKADYDQLEQVANRFANQAQVIQEMNQQVRSGMQNLQDGWLGHGSEAFFSEMESIVVPASLRLQEALDEASRATKDIVQILQQADEEASAPFRSMA
jgi:WXG100 family type VII secretion target